MSTELKNQQHEQFAIAIANGKTAEEAYRAVSEDAKPGEVAIAPRWLTRADVQRRVADLIRERTAAATMTAAERRQIVAEIARDKTVPPAVRLNATIIDAKHAGEFMSYEEHARAASACEFKKMFPSFQPLTLPEE